MRARNIKPGFAQNELLVKLPFETRLLFIMLPMMADCEGKLEDRPLKIKMALFPCDDLDIDNMLSELVRYKFLTRYVQVGCKYILINTFKEHQSPHINEKKKGSKIPDPEPKKDIQLNDDTSTVQVPDSDDASLSGVGLSPESLNLSPDMLSPESKAAPPPSPAAIEDLQNMTLPKSNSNAVDNLSLLHIYSDQIKFANSSSKNLFHVENCLKTHTYINIQASIGLMAEKYKHENTIERFKFGVEQFFDPSRISHILSDKFVVREQISASQDNLSEGQTWVLEQIENHKYDSQDGAASNLNTLDALYLVKTYLDRWKYGIKGDLLEKWVKKLTGLEKKPIQKAFDDLLLSHDKAFTCAVLVEVAKKYQDYTGFKQT